MSKLTATVTSASFALLCALAAKGASAAPVTYELDPSHTYPSFEAAHFDTSILRGKFNTTSGKVVLDKDAKSGSVEVNVDVSSIDFGNPKLNDHVRSNDPKMFDAVKFPTATYKGTFTQFKDGAPTKVDGTLTLHGFTKPVSLRINQFKCIMSPLMHKEVCGADAEGTLNRADFGVSYGDNFGFSMTVKLRIEVEGVRAD